MQVRSEGSFPGLVKDETFCPDKKAASFPEIEKHEEFFQAFGKVGAFEATRKIQTTIDINKNQANRLILIDITVMYSTVGQIPADGQNSRL